MSLTNFTQDFTSHGTRSSWQPRVRHSVPAWAMLQVYLVPAPPLPSSALFSHSLGPCASCAVLCAVPETVPEPGTACCAQTMWDCTLLVRACWGHPQLPACALGQAWEKNNKAAIYSSVIELMCAKPLTGQKSTLAYPSPFPSSSSSLCSLTVNVVIILKTFQKQPVFWNSFPQTRKNKITPSSP